MAIIASFNAKLMSAVAGHPGGTKLGDDTDLLAAKESIWPYVGDGLLVGLRVGLLGRL